jgi:2,4-dienoyl-CoA reductase (NADPH2)
VISTGRYNSVELAEGVLERGSADFVAMGRALIADPDLPLKAAAGRSFDVRPCVACEQGCIDRWLASLDVTCTVNPEAGRELEPGWDKFANGPARRVLVVGGGPAGMEAARCAALAGHDVTLWERGPALGGQLLLAARAPHGSEWAQFVTWQARQVEQAGVRVELNLEADRDAVLTSAFDDVIIATGARPAPPRHIDGWDASNVVDCFAVLRGDVELGHRVVVVGGETVAARTALHLAASGHDVTLIAGGHARMGDPESADLVRDTLGTVVRPMVLEWLGEGVSVLTRRHVKAIVPGGVIHAPAGLFEPHLTSTQVGSKDDAFTAAENVVVGGARRPEDALFEALHSAARVNVHIIGDAVAPRTVTEAVAEGAAIGRMTPGTAALTAGSYGRSR